MSKQRSSSHLLITLAVTLVILGSLTLAGLSVQENLRFVQTVDQILSLVTKTRTVAAVQQQFAQRTGEDILGDLQHMDQVSAAMSGLNAWGGKSTAVAATNAAMRIETRLPAHECRRMALYFMDHQPAALQLLSIEGYAGAEDGWVRIYPAPAEGDSIENACGQEAEARLALVFRFR